MQKDYYKSKKLVQEYIKMAKGHSGKNLIEKLILFLKKNSTILELGSGPGTDWELLSENYKVTGSDFSEEFLTHLKTNFSAGIFLHVNAIDICVQKAFDGIYSNKVLHHLTDTELNQSVKRQWEILNEGGIVCHSFWHGEGEEYFNGMYVNNHQNKKLENLFSTYFEIVLLENYAEFDTDDSILIIGRKKSLV